MNVADWIISLVTLRKPDFIIGGAERPYLLRWWVIPRNRFFNIYLHRFLRDDDDRALHDHPWPWCSIILRGSYIEHTIAAGGIHHQRRCDAGAVRFHRPKFAHRLALIEDRECWTLFITGPRVREWGFHCPEQGWIDWRKFTAANDPGAIGRGCDA